MDNPDQIAQLRELFLSAEESSVTRWIAIGLSMTLVVTVLWLVRRQRLREEFTPLWLIAAFGVALVSFWPGLLYTLTRAIGAWTASSTIFFFGQVFITSISLHFAVRLSKMTLQVKNLSQEVTLLRARVETYEREAPPEGAHGSATAEGSTK